MGSVSSGRLPHSATLVNGWTPARFPVFVVGCERSGTTLLYHALLSAGGFAVYRRETHIFNSIVPKFGGLRSAASRQRLLDRWVRSRNFELSGLEPASFCEQVMAECHSGGDFIRIFMESVARAQGMERWSDCTPAHLLYMPQIKAQIPDARFIHIVRDGRDAALSLERQGWIDPMPWERGAGILAAALHWEWMVRVGRRYGRALGADYLEVKFEDVVNRPAEVFPGIAEFIGQPMELDAIRAAGIGSVSEPNTSFRAGDGAAEFNPVGRWKALPQPELAELEAAIGGTLGAFGYAPSCVPDASEIRRLARKRRTYHAVFGAKLWLKKYTPLGRVLTGLEALDD